MAAAALGFVSKEAQRLIENLKNRQPDERTATGASQ
jgi:hypothetical protein